MTTLPSTLTISNVASEGAAKSYFEQMRNVMAETLGHTAESELTIASGVVTATAASHNIDTEGDASADDLDGVVITNHPEGRVITLRAQNASRIVTLKHASGAVATGKLNMWDSADYDLSTTDYIMFQRRGDDWYELFRTSQNSFAELTLDSIAIDSWLNLYAPRGILDPGFTCWPEGVTLTGLADAKYGPALWKFAKLTTGAVFDVKQATDVPTVAAALYGAKYSCQIDVTTADASVAAGDLVAVTYHMTGLDFAQFHQKTVTFPVWIKSPKTGVHCVAFRNSAADRSYVAEVTVNSADTWEEKSVTVALDTSGTWLLDTGIGLSISICLMGGSTYQTTAGSWQAGNYFCTSNQVNVMDDTANNFYFTLPQLNIGSTALPLAVPPQAMTEMALQYYVKRLNFDTTAAEYLPLVGVASTTGLIEAPLPFNKMRGVPTCTSSAADTFTGAATAGAVGSTINFNNIGKHSALFSLNQAGSTWTVGAAALITRDSTDTCWIMLDARH